MLKKTFTKAFMIENKGCYSDDELEALLKGREEITLEQILAEPISLKDKYWFVCKKVLTKEQNQQLAIGVAMIVLEIFENKYPNDKRPREAIEAAKAYLAGTIGIDELRQCRQAAADADAAAAAAADAAAAAAADAAAAAAAAADAAAAYAAYAADAAAAAYADAARTPKDYKAALALYLSDFLSNIKSE